MADFIFTANIILPLFLLILLGYALARLGLFTPSFLATANKLAFTVFLPLSMFRNIQQADFFTAFNWRLVLYIGMSITVLFLLGNLLTPLFVKDRKRIPVVAQSFYRCDYVLFVVPVCGSLLGAEGLAVASVTAAFVIMLFNIYAAVQLSAYNPEKKKGVWQNVKHIALNPLIVGCALGILASLLRVEFPTVLDKPLTQLAGLAVPFSLLVLGGTLSVKSLLKNLRHVAGGTFVKLALVPLALCCVSYALGFRGVEYAVIMMTFASPIALASYVMAREEHADFGLAGELVTSTALCSVVTIFLFIYVSKLLGIF